MFTKLIMMALLAIISIAEFLSHKFRNNFTERWNAFRTMRISTYVFILCMVVLNGILGSMSTHNWESGK